MARKNQRAQKRPRPTFKQPLRQNQVQPKNPGATKRPQWLKNAKARLTKPSTLSVFEQKSKVAALQQSKENATNKRKLRYSSSSDNKSYTSINKNKLKFSPLVKIMNIESDSPGTPLFENITSSNPNDIMQEENEQTQTTTGNSQCHDFPSHSSCSCSPPKGTMKSTPRLENSPQNLETTKP